MRKEERFSFCFSFQSFICITYSCVMVTLLSMPADDKKAVTLLMKSRTHKAKDPVYSAFSCRLTTVKET